ncbi:MAG TPA: hypothetical protein VHQ90_16620 [Thermoanaerobaculia bacterium]|nr:hypothetical protein [Thermoanaerobaculia bacterium]
MERSPLAGGKPGQRPDAGIQTPAESRRRYFLKLDPRARRLELTKSEDRAWKASLSYERLGPDRLALEGTIAPPS